MQLKKISVCKSTLSAADGSADYILSQVLQSLYLYKLVYRLIIFGMKHPTCVLSFVPIQTCLLNICGFSVFCLTEFLCINTSECSFLISFVPQYYEENTNVP